MMASQPKTEKNETAARKSALADWIEKAANIGPGYTRWELAYNRAIECEKTTDGLRCQAVARPCMIKQVPSADARPIQRDTK